MTVVCLYDAVTLRHFGTIERLEILAARCLYLDRPHWTQAVYDEITEAANIGRPGCRAIVNAVWLAEPVEPENTGKFENRLLGPTSLRHCGVS